MIEFCPRKNSRYFKLFCTHAAITALKWVEATCFGRNTQQVVRHRDLWQQLVKNPGVPRPFTLFLLWTFVDVHLKMWLPRGFRSRKGNWTWTKLCETNQGLGSGASEAISGCRKVGNCSVKNVYLRCQISNFDKPVIWDCLKTFDVLTCFNRLRYQQSLRLGQQRACISIL